jgi:hypothetical protein
VKAIRAVASKNDNIILRDMKDSAVAADAKKHGIGRVPAVVIDGHLADCCKSGGVDMSVLRAMGLGT